MRFLHLLSYHFSVFYCSQRRLLGFLCLTAFVLMGCPSTPWTLYRTINPHGKTQLADPYGHTLRAAGGAEFKIRRFYVTSALACMVLQAKSSDAYAEIYIDPHKARLVVGKVGIMAMKSTQAARDPLFRRMARDYFKLRTSERVKRWSSYYFPRGQIPGKQSRTGLLCFQLSRYKDDPEALKIEGKCRMQLQGVRVAKGATTLDWLYFGPLNGAKAGTK